MPVRLNITIDEDVHERLKRELPAKGISRFINDTIRARFRPSREALDKAYGLPCHQTTIECSRVASLNVHSFALWLFLASNSATRRCSQGVR
jgi:hypothetical protein